MQQKNIIEVISKNPELITEEDIKNWVVPKLLVHFSSKINALSHKVYGYQEGSNLGTRAFTEMSKDVLEKATTTFLISKKHWKTNRYITPYLITCLNRLADKTVHELNSSKKHVSPICPGCLFFGDTKKVSYSGSNFSCSECNNQVLKLKDILQDIKDPIEKNRIEFEIRLRSIFGLHSRKGYACPDCNNFIPDSYIGYRVRVSCPYDSTCSWFGNINDIKRVLHPRSNMLNIDLSLNSNINQNNDISKQTSRLDIISSNDISVDSSIMMRQNFENDIKILDSVLYAQGARYKDEKSIKKRLMYEAFINIRNKYPEDMVWYLVYQNRVSDSPIQSRIFQEYIRLIENSLPFKVRYDGAMHEVYTLQDPRLDLFLGVSEFDSVVKNNGIIPNGTVEEYFGGRSGHSRGPCFIGYLLSLTDENSENIIDKVEQYTFANIKVKDIEPGTKVKVRHLRIPAHYEMNGLIYLQRIRRKIVDSVYQRINGKKRVVKIGEKNG